MMDEKNLEKLIDLIRKDPENPLYLYALGTEYLKLREPEKAVPPLRKAVEISQGYFAAYRELARALEQSGKEEEARLTYQKGIEIAKKAGDLRTVKEMEVLLKRISK